MAKVVCEFDTVEKTLSVTLNGSPVPDIAYVSMGDNYDGKFSCDLVTARKDKENNMVIRTHVMASENAPSHAKAHAVEGFVTFEDRDETPEIIHAISAFLGD